MEATPVARTNMEDLAANPLFSRSGDPMLLVDDDRRCLDANAAACLFLRQPIAAIRQLTIDDLTAPELRQGLDTMWPRLLQGNAVVSNLLREMRMPDATSVAIDFSITPHVRPGRHLAIARFPARGALLVGAAAPAEMLTKREREVLTLVALGNTGLQIAGQLFLSPATIQTHVANALIKLNAKNRAHGIALALQANELNLEATLLRR